jgi:glycosyltransferase involved in cell wall biosynthesis
MKIAVIGSKGLPPRQGGIEHHCAEIYHRIAAKGHEVTLFARSSYINWLFNVPFFHKDVRISSLPSVPQLGFNSAFFYKDVRIASLPSIPLRGIDALVNSGLAATIASLRQFDIIHFHALGPAIFSWLPRLVNSKAKVVVTCHGIDWQRAKWGKLSTHLIKFGEKATVKHAHEIGVVSEDLGTYFQNKYNRQTTYISNAPSHYSPSNPAFPFGKSQGLAPGRYLLFLGRLVPEKQPDLLIRAG